ncbi:MAG: aspartate--tRNA ligase [Kiritimatiellae bacterium]|nr:aspartate--tRNA ligase [Kiritimatiellia bacterium]MDD5520423.1 aspartate--tRNA ligase [Kiritimatiellia bacterium]
MHPFRTNNCGELRCEHAAVTARLSGWVFRKRDHGSLLFIDLRDHYGITQVVIQPDRDFFEMCQKLRLESVITVTGKVELRSEDTINPDMPTGEIELLAESIVVESEADPLPMYLAGDDDGPEELRLKYRFLDLRRDRMHRNIMLRSKVISDIRRRMIDEHGFAEFQTPILTSSSPEGARDYLVPSRIHPGKFYALPQSPQQFKQLLMLAGFDRYFQIASCFRDEDARADRSPGEHHQLDVEMSFATPDDIFAVIESVMHGVFTKFSNWKVDKTPFRRISYSEAMVKYGTDKPDLRIPIEIADVSGLFKTSKFNAFRTIVERGGVIRAIPVDSIADKPRSFFDKLVEYAQSIGSKGLAYLVFEGGAVKGPLAKFLSPDDLSTLSKLCGIKGGDVVFFVGEMPKEANRIAGDLRLKLGRDLDRVEKDCYRFCWIIDFPMYEFDEENKTIIFSHNPFSMPQGGLKALHEKDPLTIHAYQYDIVCNGYELGSGAIRNHQPEIMYKAFEIAGYSKESVDKNFGALIKAFRLGAPPHGGIAPGIDRIVMMLSHEENIREVIAFPMNQRAQDLLMNAPNDVSTKQLRELHIRVELPKSHEPKGKVDGL